MKVELPPTLGYGAAFVTGPRSAGDTDAVEMAAGVVVRRGFGIVGGALVADAGAPGVAIADTLVTVAGVPWVTYESETAVAKQHGDLIVLGARDTTLGGRVWVGGTKWLERDATDTIGGETDNDLTRNLFGWHPRGQAARSGDARTLPLQKRVPPDTPPPPASPAAGDRLDRFQNAHRRVAGSVTFAVAETLPGKASINIAHWQATAPTIDIPVLTLSYDLPSPRLTLYLHHDGPDRAPRWCPHEQGAMALDTLVLAPDDASAAALWRASWRVAEIGADRLRRIVVTEGAG